MKYPRIYYRLIHLWPFRPLHRFLYWWKHEGFSEAAKRVIRKFQEEKSALPLRSVIPVLNSRTIKGIFVVTSAVAFDEIFNQRVINLARFLAKQGWGVIFVAWRWSKEDLIGGIGKEVHPNIFQFPVDVFLENLDELKGLVHERKYFVVEFPHPRFFPAALQLRRYGFPIIYEIIDDWEEFHQVGQSDWFSERFEQAMVLNANLLTAVSQPLLEKFSDIRQDIHLLPNGYDASLLGKSHRDIARKFVSDEIQIGYFGHLTNSWFDWDLVLRVLDLAKERGIKIHFHLVGYGAPDLHGRLESYRDRLTLHSNVQPGELHRFACQWDIATIPFRPGKLSQAVDPIKIYEYLYFGLPVIVTGIEHLKDLPGVREVRDEVGFLEALIGFKELVRGNLPSWEEDGKKVEQLLALSTWEHRFTTLVDLLEKDKWMSL